MHHQLEVSMIYSSAVLAKSAKCEFLSLYFVFVVTNSIEPHEMPHLRVILLS